MTSEFPTRDTLERQLGKPRAEWSAGDLVEFAVGSGVRLISLMHVGGDGWLKTLDFVPRSAAHLRDIIDGGERADGSSLFPGMGIVAGASDVVLRPRPESAFLDPFAERPTLVVRCGHLGRDGRPLPQSPDTILRSACTRLEAELGVELTALGEIEYFLGKPYAPSDIYGAHERGYHALAPFVFGQDHRRLAMDVLTGLGIPVKYGHSEVGYIEARDPDPVIWEQHEIELALAPLPEAGRWVVLTQWVLRNLAHRSGMLCNFAPIVREGHAGNGLHFHLSPVSNGRHVAIRNGEGALAAEAKWLIAGLVRLGASLMAFGNRAQGSFVRLSQGKEAPRAIFWGDYDRRALIRLPIVPTAADGRSVSPSTVEFRLPDGSAHPYLLLAGVAQAMLLGRSTERIDDLIESASAAGAEANGSAGPVSPVPRHPREVAEALIAGRAALESGGVFPSVLIDGVLARLAS